MAGESWLAPRPSARVPPPAGGQAVRVPPTTRPSDLTVRVPCCAPAVRARTVGRGVEAEGSPAASLWVPAGVGARPVPEAGPSPSVPDLGAECLHEEHVCLDPGARGRQPASLAGARTAVTVTGSCCRGSDRHSALTSTAPEQGAPGPTAQGCRARWGEGAGFGGSAPAAGALGTGCIGLQSCEVSTVRSPGAETPTPAGLPKRREPHGEKQHR